MYAKRGGMTGRVKVLVFLGSCCFYGMLSSMEQTSVCAPLPIDSGCGCRLENASRSCVDKTILMPSIQAPDEARIAKNQQAIEQRLHKNARNRLLMRAVTLLGVGAVGYNLFVPAKNFVFGWLRAKKQNPAAVTVPPPVQDQQIREMYEHFNAPWWHKACEVVGYSSLGFFVTQQLERASDALAESLFYPVTLRWFIEHSHPIIVARTVVLEGNAMQEGAQEVTITRSPYLEEIERFIAVCSDQAALSVQAHDTQTYCVITGINSFISQLEKVLGFMGYQQHAAPALADQRAVTRAALYSSAQHFCVSVQEILQSSTTSLPAKKESLVILLHEMKAELSRLIVDRLYRLESEE